MVEQVCFGRAAGGFRIFPCSVDFLLRKASCLSYHWPREQTIWQQLVGKATTAGMGTFADKANVDYRYRLPTKENKLQFSVFRIYCILKRQHIYIYI
jgi:hypothetical protein